jgi:hypothetical protein
MLTVEAVTKDPDKVLTTEVASIDHQWISLGQPKQSQVTKAILFSFD